MEIRRNAVMFDDNRYITSGINREVSLGLQLIMWDMIDRLKQTLKNKVDYLQVFELRQKGTSLKITHRQEVPQYTNTIYVEALKNEIEGELKVFVIDENQYSIMLLAEEY